MRADGAALRKILVLLRRASVYRLHEGGGIRNRTEDAPLHFDHLDRRLMVSQISRAAAVRQQQAFETAIVRFPHRGMDAYVGRDTAEHPNPR